MKHAFLAASMLAASPVSAQSSPTAGGVEVVKPAVIQPASTEQPIRPAAIAISSPPPHRSRRAPSAAELRVRSANRQAIREPATGAFINAVQVYPYSEGALYRLFAAPERITDIALQPGEAIVSVAAGDTARWTVGDTTSGEGEARRVHILVKPFAAGLSTNLLITTDRRAYHLQLESTATAMAALSWTYPTEELLAIRRRQAAAEAAKPVAAGVAIDLLNFDYSISGDTPAWRPLRAFDDGRQTFIQFPASIAVGEAPPLFVLGEEGDPQLVNYRMSGRFYVIDRLLTAAELRLGGKKQSVVRISRAAGARHQVRRGRAS